MAADPGAATFTGATAGTAPFAAVDGDSTTFTASLGSGDLDPGLEEETAAATVDGEPAGDSVPLLALAADDQAPGVGLVEGADDDAWRRLDSVDGDDLDDVYAVTLGRGDRLEVSIASRSPDPVAALLFDAGTTDVFGQLDQVRACGGGEEVGCPTSGLTFEAETRGTYLLDVFSTGSTGDYRLTWTVRTAAGLPVEVPVPACSPNGDGVKDRCAWSATELAGWTVTSFVTSGTASVDRQTGGGARSWDGGDSGPGGYTLRVLYTGAGGRALLRTFPLVLDTQRPRIADARAAPNPFEPRPDDGDRDTTTFAMTSSERAGSGSSSTATPARRWSGSWSAAPRRPGASGSPGPGRRRPGPGCGGPSPTSSRPPTPPATPPAHSATTCGCCSASAFRGRGKVPSDNGLTGLSGSARVGERPADRPSSAGRVSRDWCRPRRYPL